MTKETSVVFLVGLVAVVLVRGGWRHWPGLLSFVVIAAAVSLPWYLYHLSELNGLVEGQGGTGAAPGAEAAPPLLSHSSLLWYFWAAVNFQLLVPLFIFLLVGAAWTLRDCVRRWKPENLGPELLGGGIVSWLGITLIRHKDVRFTLPALIYVAVIATGWIVMSKPRMRVAATAILAVVLAADFFGTSIGIGHAVRIALPGAPSGSGIYKRQFTLYTPEGYVRGGPKSEGDILTLMRELKKAGVENITFEAGSTAGNPATFSTFGLTVRATQAGLPTTPVYDPASIGPHDAFMLLHVPRPGDPPPCRRGMSENQSVYVELGDPLKPFEEYTFICPKRDPEIYRRTAPLSMEIQIQLHPEITGPTHTMLLNVLLGLHAHGIQALQFDHASAQELFFQAPGLEKLAEVAQLPVPPSLTPQQLTADDAYLERRPVSSSGPRPCGRFPDGTGLYVVLGDPLVASPHYYCPVAEKPKRS